MFGGESRGIRPILEHWFFDTASVRWHRTVAGLSGSLVWRVELPEGQWALKRWAIRSSVQRLEAIHCALLEIAHRGFRQLSVPLVSRHGCTLVIAPTGNCWEMTPWMPGRPLERHEVRKEHIELAANQLATFHCASQPSTYQFCQKIGSHSEASALSERSGALRSWKEQRWAWLKRIMERHQSEVSSRHLEALEECRCLISRLLDRVSVFAHRQLHCQLIAGDLWRANVLFAAGSCSFIDFGAMRVDIPEADLARLLGSLAGDESDWYLGLETYYKQVGSAIAAPYSWLAWLYTSGVTLSVLNWMWWIYVEHRSGPRQLMHKRLDELITDLERITAGGWPRD